MGLYLTRRLRCPLRNRRLDADTLRDVAPDYLTLYCILSVLTHYTTAPIPLMPIAGHYRLLLRAISTGGRIIIGA